MSGIFFEHNELKDDFYISHIKRKGSADMHSNHFHDTYEVYYLLSGERYYFIKDRVFHVKEKDLILIKAGDLHKTTSIGRAEHERFLINFHKGFVETFMKDVGVVLYPFENNINLVRLPLKHQTKLEELLSMMIDEIMIKEPGYEGCVKAILLQLLIYIGRYTENSEFKPFQHLNPMYKKISEIVQYLNKNFMEKIGLNDISKQFYISRFYLSKTFREVTGFSFVEYLNNVRIKESQKLLATTNKKVIEICYEVGFGSVAHFGRVFKVITGYSPLQYRKSNSVK